MECEKDYVSKSLDLKGARSDRFAAVSANDQPANHTTIIRCEEKWLPNSVYNHLLRFLRRISQTPFKPYNYLLLHGFSLSKAKGFLFVMKN